MGVNYAVREQKSCSLSSDWAREFVIRHFGALAAEKIFAALPRYVRGKNKGQPKGWVQWVKCTHGGWVKTGSYDHDAGRGNGYVMAPGTHDVKIILTHPAYSPERCPSLDAGDRRGLPTDTNRETDEQWANRCARAIYQLAGLPVPAEFVEPPYVPPFNARKFVESVLAHFVTSTQKDGYVNFGFQGSPEAQAVQAIAKILVEEL